MKSTSWVIYDKATGMAVFETYNFQLATKINHVKFGFMPIYEWLCKLNEKIKIGTKVKIAGVSGWLEICRFDETRSFMQLKGVCGSFQSGHIIKFTNKKG